MINRDGNVWFHHDFYSQFARQSDAFVSYFIKWHGILSPQYSVCLCQCIRWLIPGCWCFKSLGSRTEMVVSNGIAEFIWGYVYRLCCVLDAVYCPYWWPLFTPFRDWVTAPQCVGMNEKQILSEFYLKCFWSAFPIPPLWLCINWWLVCVMNRMNTAATIQNGMSLHSMPSNVGWNDEITIQFAFLLKSVMITLLGCIWFFSLKFCALRSFWLFYHDAFVFVDRSDIEHPESRGAPITMVCIIVDWCSLSSVEMMWSHSPQSWWVRFHFPWWMNWECVLNTNCFDSALQPGRIVIYHTFLHIYHCFSLFVILQISFYHYSQYLK